MKIFKKKIKNGPKVGNLFGIKISSTSKAKVLEFVESNLQTKEKFYIVTPNPEIVLMATKDWALKKAIDNSTFAIPDGIGLAQAHKFLNFEEFNGHPLRLPIIFIQGMAVGLATIFNKKYLTDDLEIMKGRELFLDILKILDKRGSRVYLFGGEHGEQELAKVKLEAEYKDITFKTHHKFPIYAKSGQPLNIEERKLHKSVMGDIKLFEPDFIFVAMTPPKQEKWVYWNFFKLNATGAMTVGGTYNFISGRLSVPPVWLEKIGLEWVWRLLTEPTRWRRIFNAFPVFPWKVFMYKVNLPLRGKLRK